MSTTREITLWCDWRDCVKWIQLNNSDSNGGKLVGARSTARKQGWSWVRPNRLIGGMWVQDLCPEHTRSRKALLRLAKQS